jgi:hypothetical protein
MEWSYGLVRDGNIIKLCEVYSNGKKLLFYIPVFEGITNIKHIGWIIRDIPMMVKDVWYQLRHFRIIESTEMKGGLKDVK